MVDGRYEVVRALGRGGLASVYEARDRLFDRDVAMKSLSFGSAGALEAFRREFSLLSACAHPRLPRAYDFARTTSGGAPGQPLTYATTELIRGRTLAEHARGRAFRAALPVLLDALDALGWLHGAGIVHGDFKPENVLVRDDGAGVLIDLSAARRMRADAGDLSGTARFFAPELLRGAPPSARTDLFAVGRTLEALFPLLSGAPPAAVRRLAGRLTADDPASRPSGIEEVLEALSAGGLPRRAPAVVSEPGEIVGREREVEAFGAALEALLRGERGPRAVIVTGEEGAGKSRLFRELKWRAQLSAQVVEGAPRGDDPLRALLVRALGGAPLPAGVDALLGARGELAGARGREGEAARAPRDSRDPADLRAPRDSRDVRNLHALPAPRRPRVLAIDDAHRLGAHDRALLEALVRSAEPTDAVLWLIASAERLDVGGGAVVELPLGPLGEDAVRVWTAPLATAARTSDLLRASGGRPRALKELCAALAQRSLSEAELDRFVHTTGTPELWRRRVAALDRGEARALAALAVADPLGPEAAAALGVGRAALDALEAAGLARLDGEGFRLGQAGQARALLPWLDAGAVREVAAAMAAHLAGADEAALAPALRSQRAADRARALVLAGDHEAARRALAASGPMLEWAPRAWVRAADAACEVLPAPRTLVAAASAIEAAGDPRRALSLLARARRAGPPADVGAELSYRAARCYEKLGKVERALWQLGRARALAPGPWGGRLASLSARCLLRLGRYDEARREAEGALAALGSREVARALASGGAREAAAELASGEARETAAELAETLGLALGYLSDQAGALQSLARAVALRPASGSPRARARTLSYHALHAYRAGDAALAARGFQEALDLAEAEGLGDLLATAALNLGTARHQLGDWGAALRCYERGLRAAIAFAKERTEATLRFNLAKIHADVGLLERAELAVARMRAPEGPRAPEEIAVAALGLAAEIAAARGALGEAARLLEEARAGHAARGSKREACEAVIHAAEVALAARDRAAASARLAEAAALLREADAADLALRHATAGAELALARGDTDAALAEVQRGAGLVARVSQLELHAKHEEASAEVLRLRSATALAERHRTAALECWERIGSTLPAELAEVFWRHPRRAALRGGPAPPGARMELVLKLLEVNRRLSSTLDAEEVLRLAMDAAIELTGAERGFVILTSPSLEAEGHAKGKLEVAVARNLDRERVGKSQLKFSHGIAKRVVERGEAVLTVDALADERFHGNASVHGLRLRSIVCVPIRAHGAVLGAVYLDNRFQRGKFAEGDADLLGAFADQIAVALHNGRLMAELRDRTRALEEEQRRVAELMRSQADEIERLSHELERTRADARRDFPEIAGRSAPMRAVLALCERVAESDVTVTVTGESGTGKELVARAIHAGGPRRDGPFVAVNCAALPEALLESELFGHVKGAFTGAVREHGGLFVSARGGTLFLDELGEVPLGVQAKLLRALQERSIRPVGSDRSVSVADVRVVCATNRDLREEVARGRFREDLYYRISVIEIRLPPLRDRPDDIPAIAQAIVEKLAARQGRPAFRLSRGALRRLSSYGWPGNVRQLENVLSRACVLSPGPEIGAADIQLPAAAPAPRGRSRAEHQGAEEERIRAALELSRWNVCEVSRSLGIPRMTLYRKLARYGLLRKE
ncbi:sigma 54-interacting transcriptional regulator [Sorangium atrum]|uniref:Sigma 54-interacting transcriptional regulator n=1 Tax=Sorangium atrum TaxID=2995308 RepID=A0ABT5C930_9BACT|nr:sigma 54-interacting transcriptional regulator [Sorangium aterium]MDC0682952.1 sigma 54-interacting transcriptional regulator [Sorangium aterium]